MIVMSACAPQQGSGGTTPNSAPLTTVPFVLRHKGLFSLYLSCLARLLLKSPRNEVYRLFNQIYFRSEQWRELVRLYTAGVF
jgi:hypothetical protein